MKILFSKNEGSVDTIDEVAAGSVVHFPVKFNNTDAIITDRYLVLSVPACYLPAPRKRTYGHDTHDDTKIGVANLRSGALSYVKPSRKCLIVDFHGEDNGYLIK